VKYLLAVLLFTSILGVRSAHAEIQAWQVITLMTRLDEKASGPAGWLDLQLRRRGGSTQYLARPALGWALSPTLFLHAGYAWIPTDPDDGTFTSEHRIWQQALFNGIATPTLKYQLRARVEQRFGPSSGVGHRIRALGRLQWQPSRRVPLQLIAWDEVFVGVNETTDFALQGFDQNRAFAGIGVETPVTGLRVEAGYLNLLSQAGDRTDHVIGFFVIVNTWLRCR
jgi:hypothetical protein